MKGECRHSYEHALFEVYAVDSDIFIAFPLNPECEFQANFEKLS